VATKLFELVLVVGSNKEEERDTSSSGNDDREGIRIKDFFHLMKVEYQKSM